MAESWRVERHALQHHHVSNVRPSPSGLALQVMDRVQTSQRAVTGNTAGSRRLTATSFDDSIQADSGGLEPQASRLHLASNERPVPDRVHYPGSCNTRAESRALEAHALQHDLLSKQSRCACPVDSPWCSGRPRSRTGCLWVMSPAWKPFHSPASIILPLPTSPSAAGRRPIRFVEQRRTRIVAGAGFEPAISGL